MSADLFAAFGDSGDAGTPGAKFSKTTFQELRQNPSNDDKGLGITTSDTAISTSKDGKSRERPLWERDSHGNDVLFDAMADDEFGDFEDIQVPYRKSDPISAWNSQLSTQQITKPPTNASYAPRSIDLLSVGNEYGNSRYDYSSAPVTPNFSEDTRMLGHTPKLSPAILKEEDDWGDFETGGGDVSVQIAPENQMSAFVSAETQSGTDEFLQDSWEPIDSWETPPSTSKTRTMTNGRDQPVRLSVQHVSQPTAGTQKSTSMHVERPTNVPPPAILLGLLPAAFEQLMDATEIQDTQASVQADKILSLFHVAGRIIAGRSIRWKRDTILAQSTRIGQAGKSGGMKLAAVNKGEEVREESEAAEVVEAWSRRAHYFSSVILRAKFHPPQLKLSLSMPVKASTSASTLNARHICPICGLKRSERIAGIDDKIEDLFEDFWIENWGHKDCSDFWYKNHVQLDQR